jgi:hypothetical protein
VYVLSFTLLKKDASAALTVSQFRNNMLALLEDTLRSEIKKQLDAVLCVSITSDGWPQIAS